MDHHDRTRAEFSRQASHFAASPALNDSAQLDRLVDAIGDAAAGKLLDLACGPGIVSAALARRGGSVVGLDLTPEMLVKARERCAKAGLANASFVEGRATALPFADDHFDAVVTRLSFHHFTDPAAVLAEMRRVLRPGGLIAIADVVSAEDADKAELQNAIETLRDPSHVRMLPASELISIITATGLTIERQETWDKPRDFEEWVGIVADPDRVRPLRVVVHALAASGHDAGMGLRLANGNIAFFHRWQLIAARKP